MTKPILKRPRVENKAHARFVPTLPCLVTGYEGEENIGHHLLCGGHRGMGMKNGDDYLIPLRSSIHDMLHKAKMKEPLFLDQYGINDPVEVAKTLYLMIMPQDAYEYILNRFSKNWPKNIRMLTK